MADQRIFFEQGDTTTGDSGERGDDTVGVDSIKPYIAGELASQAVFNRPVENTRKRTEALRVAGEEAKYLLDSNMAWIIAAGNATGLSPGPEAMPGISSWDPVGGTFVTSAPIVVQPINTPGSDLQETVTYSFTDGLSQTAAITFAPIGADPASSGVSQKRAYSGANLIRIVWQAVPYETLASAAVPNYCDAVISGDPSHILTISIRDDGDTQMANVATAMAAVDPTAGVELGLGYVVTGTTATGLLISEVPVLDYRMKNTFEREVHYIPTASFASFFAVPNALADGDTLSIYYPEYTSDNGVTEALTGRRESVPSNITGTYPDATTVAAVDLFITSTAADVNKIPLSIPLCKRIGDDLYWMDGTVVKGTQISLPVYFGENGVTVDRASAASASLLAADSNVTGHWLFNDIISIGATRAVITSNDYAIYARRYTSAPVAANLYGVYLDVQASQDVGGELVGIHNSVLCSSTVATGVSGINTTVSVNANPGGSVISNLTNLTITSTVGATPTVVAGTASQIAIENTQALTKATAVHGTYQVLHLAGGAVTDVFGYNLSVPSSLPGTPDDSAITNFYGFNATIALPTTVTTSGIVYGLNIDLDTQAAASVYGSSIVVSNSGAVTGYLYGGRTTATAQEVTGWVTGSRVLVDSNVSGVVTNEMVGSSVEVVPGATADVVYGVKVAVDCTVPANTASSGLMVTAVGTHQGADITATNVAEFALKVSALGTTPGGLSVTAPLSYFSGSLNVGGALALATSASLQVVGSFATTPVDVDISTIGTSGGSIPTDKASLIILTDTAGAVQEANKLTLDGSVAPGGINGQQVTILNDTNPATDLTLVEAGGNLILAGAASVVSLSVQESITFVYIAARTQWYELRRSEV